MPELIKKRAERVLVVDDDRNTCLTVKKYLGAMGYEVETASTGSDGLKRALAGNFDAVILDVLLPEMDGFEVLKELRRQSGVPVLMFTTRDEVTDRVVGLEIGADDYLPKLFTQRELLARLRAVIRSRTYGGGTPTPPAMADFGRLKINGAAHEAFLDGVALDITPIEFKLLLTLAQKPGEALTREQLMDAVAGREYDVFDRAIDMHISSLRKKLNDAPHNPQFIKTIRATGYLFIPVRKGGSQ